MPRTMMRWFRQTPWQCTRPWLMRMCAPSCMFSPRAGMALAREVLLVFRLLSGPSWCAPGSKKYSRNRLQRDEKKRKIVRNRAAGFRRTGPLTTTGSAPARARRFDGLAVDIAVIGEGDTRSLPEGYVVDPGSLAGGDDIAGTQGTAATSGKLEYELHRSDGAAGQIERTPLTDTPAFDEGFTGQAFKRAGTPLGNRRPDDEAGGVAKVRHDRGRAEVVDD